MDIFNWTHPKGHKSVPGQIFVDCGSDVVQVRVPAEVDGPQTWLGNTTAEESLKAFRVCWWKHYGKPTVLRTDPEGCFRAKGHKDALTSLE